MFPGTDQLLHYPPRPIVAMDRRWKASVEVAPNCPRCASTNTKFCYYNNYSLSQPRYFCKGCRRYWTKGGTLRIVPVGGGCRKSRRARSARSLSASRGLPGSDGRSTNSSSDSDCSRTDPVDIDLAAVFAKFLNPNSCSHDNQQAAQNSDNTAIIDSQSQESSDKEGQLFDEFPQLMVDAHKQHEGRIDGMIGYDLPSSLDDCPLQERTPEGIVNYDIPSSFNDGVQDGFWSDSSDAAALSNFPWQPMAPLQEFDSPPMSIENQSTYSASTDLLGDNWSCFDLSGCEVFLRP